MRYIDYVYFTPLLFYMIDYLCLSCFPCAFKEFGKLVSVLCLIYAVLHDIGRHTVSVMDVSVTQKICKGVFFNVNKKLLTVS